MGKRLPSGRASGTKAKTQASYLSLPGRPDQHRPPDPIHEVQSTLSATQVRRWGP